MAKEIGRLHMRKILICGYGDIGARVAQTWKDRHAQVCVLCRTDPVLKDSQKTIKWLSWDLDKLSHEKTLSLADIVYYFAPPPATGDKDTRIGAFLSSLAPPKKFVLISTSAVYGDCGGAWVTEAAETQPISARGKRRLDAEQISRDWCDRNGVEVVILRVPGIYGPGRLPIERIKKGLPVLQAAIAPYTNRIHCADLAQVCVEVALQDVAGIFNVCDGEPGNMSQYFFAVADAYGLPRPAEVDMEQAKRQLSAGMLSYLSESRRMDNRKLLQQTGYQMLYPNLAAGLAACLAE
ncbi:MAG: SDR family oxidoreductase [Thiohalomonadales bacterium]